PPFCPLSLHDALPICVLERRGAARAKVVATNDFDRGWHIMRGLGPSRSDDLDRREVNRLCLRLNLRRGLCRGSEENGEHERDRSDRKSTRLNSSHVSI